MSDTHLAIAGIRALVSTDEHLLADFLRRAGAYQTPPSPVDLVMNVVGALDFTPSRPVRAVYPAPEAAFENGRYRFWRRDLEVEIAPGTPLVATARCLADRGIAIENVWRLCLSTMVPLRGGLMLHASAVQHGGWGYVFTGTSGAGKSTIVKLLQQDACATSLGDEVTVVMASGRGVTVHSTPFGGELEPVSPASAPLRRLYLLDPRGTLPENAAQRSARVLRNALVMKCQPHLADALLRAAQEIVTRVECRVIFRPTRQQLEREFSV
jgi:hypothetical protein